MKTTMRSKGWLTAMAFAATAGLLAACQSMAPMMKSYDQTVSLAGSNEVPPVTTAASGSGTVTIKPDRSVSVKITVTGMTATAAHIHEAAAGANGPVIVPFTKQGDDTFVSAPGATLTEAQYASYKAGNLYVNVHSAKNPGGEIRAQLKGI